MSNPYNHPDQGDGMDLYRSREADLPSPAQIDFEMAQYAARVAAASEPRKELVLPPDPEGMNEARAERAETVIDAYMAADDAMGDDVTSLVDLLADLRHWCDRHQVSFEDALASSYNHYQAETEGESE